MSESKVKQSSQRPGGFGGRRRMMRPGEKAKDFKGAMKDLARYIGVYKWPIFAVWIMALASTVFVIAGPKILGNATDEIFSGMMRKLSGTGGINFDKLLTTLLWVAGLYGASSLFSYLQGLIMSVVTAKTTYRMRNDLAEKIHKLPLKYYDKTTHGDVLSRITNDIDTISHTMNQSITQIISSVTSIIGFTVMMLTISWRLTLIALIVIPLSGFAVVIIVKKSQGYFTAQQKYLGSVNGHVEEMFSNHAVVKAFNGEEESVKTFSEQSDMLYESAWKSSFLSGLIMPITSLIGNLAYVAICILGGYYAANGEMTVGGIQAFIQYVRSFNRPITQIVSISNVLQQTAAAAERVFEFLNETEEVKEPPNALTVNKNGSDGEGVKIEGHVTFKNVSFGYDEDKIIIKNFNASIKPGQKIAIVGPTGAGKTTIVKILMRFYELNSGSVKIDGHDIRDFKRSELRSVFGMVLQDTWLFNGTIAENIRYGRLDATDDEVEQAARAAQVDHFVRTLPNGYDMMINEESDNISQGQKQLLTIARAFLADPKILILDEATSSVDTRTEVLIQKAMDNLMRGRTGFVIAHRLSTIKNADLILVIDDGDIVEQGTHSELLAKGGFYYDMYSSQFKTVG
ncbi:MAG: ABC transporter ATP-binding protein [Ruminococcaceae bacterium]|nr:ABC transporter ATP-binding protein [Oscillospiraceae bacterium]